MALKLKKFALKRGILSACVAGIINIIIVYLALQGKGEVPLFASVAEIWNHSLIGALIPRSIIISFIITVTTMYATAREISTKSGDISKRLEKSSWIKTSLQKAMIRALIAFIVVILFAYVLRLIFPTYATLSVAIVIPFVGIFASIVAFSMTYSAVISTGKILSTTEPG